MQKSEAAGKQNSFSQFDIAYMKRAFALARRGKGKTSPNPMVGALLVKKGQIIGEGWHHYYGGPHAEIEAINSALAAGHSPKGADLYCTLEPCCFDAPDKKQPPCTSLLISSGIKSAIIANIDPNPRVKGKGIALLEAAGIEIKTGLCQEEGEELNRAFFAFQRLGRPFVHLKTAQSLDGRIAAQDYSSRWIGDESARRFVHRLRGEYDAVLIGRGTALVDDPELTVRLVKGRNPQRVILDSNLALPETAKLLSLPGPEKTIIFHSNNADAGKAEKLRSLGAELIPVQSKPHLAHDGLPLSEVLPALAKRGVLSVLVEGGAAIFRSFLLEGHWDRLSIFISPIILGDGVNFISGLGFRSMAEALRFKKGSFRRIGSQMLFEVGNEEAK
jgi:diaminohydroxyphosphoribosylaminopyrimidine deaminase/5-amino-6-(5-phosphoribosylamino)uracil reductase